MKKPEMPCTVCKKYAWYWPGDYYWGEKEWVCGVCHPHNEGEPASVSKPTTMSEPNRISKPEGESELRDKSKPRAPSEPQRVSKPM